MQSDLRRQDRNRPWRLLCLIHFVIATRTGNPKLARKADNRLIEFLPEKAEAFFAQGMKHARKGQFSIQRAEPAPSAAKGDILH